MKKAGAKGGQLVRSASRRGKTASKFHFDFTVERLFPAQKNGNTYYIKWSRGVKVAQTKPVLVTKEMKGGTKSAGGMPFAHKMSLIVTLYRTDNRFDEKDSKLALISVNEKGQERTVAKMHFDLAAFAGVPSASATKIFKLSDKASVKCTIDSRLVKSGPKGPGSGGASSMMSGMTGVSDGEDPEDDFDDLDIGVDDVPDPESPAAARAAAKARATSSSSSSPSPAPAAAAPGPSSLRSRLSSSTASAAAAVAASSAPSPAAASRKSGGGGGGSGGSGGGSGGGGGGGGAAAASSSAEEARLRAEDAKLRAEVKSMREENERLAMDVKRGQEKRKRIEAAHEAEIGKLRAKIEAGGGGSRGGDDAALRRAQEDAARAADKAAAARRELSEACSERDRARNELSAAQSAAKEMERLRAENKELGRDLDKLTASAGAVGSGDDVVRERLAKLQAEKETVEKKLGAHQAHSAKVKDTYQKLTVMYNTLRQENIDLQEEKEALVKDLEVARKAASRSSAGGGGASGDAELMEALAEAEQAVVDMEESKMSLQRDMDRLTAQTESLQERLDEALDEMNRARKESDTHAGLLTEMTAERDAALARAKKSGGKGGGAFSAEGEAKLAVALKERENVERELVRMRQRTSELEREVKDRQEDLDYEKAEKVKAREERDALRESARALERRTSQVSQTADAVHSLKRQLSTHKMREADQSAMISDLRDEVERLQSDVDRLTADSSGGRGGDDGGNDDGAVLEQLVMTKMALAEAEDQKLRLEFDLKTQRKNERAVQEKLAAHASRLEVKLGEANEELAKARQSEDKDKDSLL